jgi:hypothetical protein
MLRFIKVMTQRPENQLAQNAAVEEETTVAAE